MELIKNADIRLNSCWNIVEKDIFRKIRKGLTQHKSPVDNRDPRLQKLRYDN